MNALIVGAGYTARYLLPELMGLTNRVFTLNRHADFAHHAFHIQADLDNAVHTRTAMQQLDDIDVVFYFAPPKPQGNEDTRMQHLLQALESWPPTTLIYISTSGVYGDCAGAWVTEETPTNPQTARAKRRVSAEQQLLAYANQHAIKILRVPGIYGPSRLPVQKIIERNAIVNEQESGYSNVIHVLDLVTVSLAAWRNGEAGHIYNVSDTQPIKSSVYYKTVARLAHLPPPEEVSLAIAKQRFDQKRLSFLLESRRLVTTKMRDSLKPILRFTNIEDGIRYSLEN